MSSSSPSIQRAISTVSNWSNYLSAFALALMVMHVTVDVIFRYFFNAPLTGTIEVVSAYYMVAVIAFPLAYVHDQDQHIRVELFTGGLSEASKARLDSLVEVVIFACLLTMAFFGFEEAWSRSKAGEVWEAGQTLLPIWPARWFLPIGFLLMAVVSLARIVASITNSRFSKVR